MDAQKVQLLRLLEKQNALHFPVFFILFENLEQRNILQTITHVIQYTVMEIQFWSVKCTTVTVGYAKISSNISYLPIQAMQAIMDRLDAVDKNKPLQNAFKRI